MADPLITCTAVTSEMWSDFIFSLVFLTSLFSVGTLLFGHVIWSGVIAPWIARRTSASAVEMMKNEKALDELVEKRIRLRQIVAVRRAS